jgi:hypothetical protein
MGAKKPRLSNLGLIKASNLNYLGLGSDVIQLDQNLETWMWHGQTPRDRV